MSFSVPTLSFRLFSLTLNCSLTPSWGTPRFCRFPLRWRKGQRRFMIRLCFFFRFEFFWYFRQRKHKLWVDMTFSPRTLYGWGSIYATWVLKWKRSSDERWRTHCTWQRLSGSPTVFADFVFSMSIISAFVLTVSLNLFFSAPRHGLNTQCNHWFRGFSRHTRRNRIQGWWCLSLFFSRERKKLKLMRRGSKTFDFVFFGYAIFDNSRGKLFGFAGVRRRWVHAPLSNPHYRFAVSRARLNLHKKKIILFFLSSFLRLDWRRWKIPISNWWCLSHEKRTENLK